MNVKRFLQTLRRRTAVLLGALSLSLPVCVEAAAGAENALGERIYNEVCVGCHHVGVLGAPKQGDIAAWGERLEKGLDTLVQHALEGFGNMPAKGGKPSLTEPDVRAAIRYMAGEAIPDSASTVTVAAVPEGEVPSDGPDGESTVTVTPDRAAQVVNQVCQGCHQIGVLGAPKIGNAEDWAPRLEQGEDTLVQHALEGFGNMPPKGGRADLTANELRAAIRYMIEPPEPEVAAAEPASPPTAEAAAISAPPKAAPQAGDPNRFNRLMRPRSERNPPPAEDGIHDPDNEGTTVLQAPRQAFEALPDGKAGNYVDWVKALEEGAIEPRWDLADPSKLPAVMELNIVREVKGTMPNVVYPHKQHLQWLDCANCHPQIFIPQKGANSISMAEIIMGRKCGVCHGKVAFPINECRRCHSLRKPDVAKE